MKYTYYVRLKTICIYGCDGILSRVISGRIARRKFWKLVLSLTIPKVSLSKNIDVACWH